MFSTKRPRKWSPTGRPWTPQWAVFFLGVPVGASSMHTVLVAGGMLDAEVPAVEVASGAEVTGAMEVSITQVTLPAAAEAVVGKGAAVVVVDLVGVDDSSHDVELCETGRIMVRHEGAVVVVGHGVVVVVAAEEVVFRSGASEADAGVLLLGPCFAFVFVRVLVFVSSSSHGVVMLVLRVKGGAT